jgi:hypothetical protein
MASPLSALHMKASGSHNAQVISKIDMKCNPTRSSREADVLKRLSLATGRVKLKYAVSFTISAS